jgi:hypothetical protein
MIKAITTVIILLSFAGCSQPFLIEAEKAGALSTKQLCQRIAGSREALGMQSREVIQAWRNRNVKIFSSYINNGLQELKARGFTDKDLLYIKQGQISENMSEKAQKCVSFDQIYS